jgi:regulator of sirC expression with transglutaminase-like and TPR domain
LPGLTRARYLEAMADTQPSTSSAWEDVFLALLERGEENLQLPMVWAALTAAIKGNLDIPKHLAVLAALKDEAAVEVTHQAVSVHDSVLRLNEFFRNTARFRGNELVYNDPANSYFDDVLRTRLGIPITLSLVFIELGSACGLEFLPIGFPAHFLVMERSQGILCDPFHGRIDLRKADCLAIAQRIFGKDFAWEEQFLSVASKTNIVIRLLNNLRNHFLSNGDADRQALAESLLQKVAALGVAKPSLTLN